MIIVEGDHTSGGGRVLTGSHETDIDGLRVARVNDKCTCPIHKGTFPIVTGDVTSIVDGQPVARHGDKLACGCTLISTRQFRVFLDDQTSDNPTADNAMFAAASVATAVASTAASRADQDAHVHTGGAHEVPPDPGKARDVVDTSNTALMDAEAFRGYETELEAAKSWAAIVEPIANAPEFGVEVGANISKVGDKYVLGTAYSTGSRSSCDRLPQDGHKVSGGKHTAYIHTHPQPGGGVSRNRAFELGDFPNTLGIGGESRTESGWDISSGDYTTAYRIGLNAYIAEPGGILEWNYERYLELQRATGTSFAGPAVELGDAEIRH